MATDTIALAEQLEGAIHDDHQTEHLATKADLLALKAELSEFRAEMRFHRWLLALLVALVLAVLGKVW